MHNMHGITLVHSKVPAVVDVQVGESYTTEGCEFMRRTVSKQGQPVGRCMSNSHVYSSIIITFVFCLLDAKLQIGFLTQQKSKSLLKEGDVSEQDIKKFYFGVRAFFETATSYSLQNLSHKDDVLKKNAGFVMFENRMSADQLQADFFVSRYICAMLAQ